MATWAKGVIVWQGDYGQPESHLSKGSFRDVTDAAALDTLATALLAYTDCNVYAKHFNSITETGSAAPGVDANVDEKAMIVMKDSADGSVAKFLIPAPVSTMFEMQDQGDRVTAVALAAIVAAVNAATGKTYVGMYGKKLQKG